MTSSRLTIEADFTVEFGSEHVAVLGSGSTLTLQLDSFRQAWRLFRKFRAIRQAGSSGKTVRQLLDRASVTVEVLVGRRRIWSLGPGRRSLLARWLFA